MEENCSKFQDPKNLVTFLNSVSISDKVAGKSETYNVELLKVIDNKDITLNVMVDCLELASRLGSLEDQNIKKFSNKVVSAITKNTNKTTYNSVRAITALRSF